MKTQSILLAALASAPAALAHTSFTDFFVNGMPQGDGVAMRMSPHPESAGSPIASLDSDDMACNVGGTKGVARVQSVPDGALLSFEIRSWADDPSKPPLSRQHYGPCAMYLKKVSSAIDDTAAGDGWFKIFDHGYDASTKRWCTDEIIDNKGLFNINLPKGLQGGQYLARPEILALHNAPNGDPQFYTGCAQINVEGSGNLGPETTISIPGHVKFGEPSTSFNIYTSDLSTYQLPGPAVAKLVAKSDGASTASTLTVAQGAEPEGCIVENANWCGKELPDYSDEKGCWAADADCWAQMKVCWDTAPPTGGKGCELWETKCKGNQDQCKAKNFNGPPNKGQILTPQKKSIDVGLVMSTKGGGVVDAPSSPKTSDKPVESKTPAPAQPTPTPAAEEKPEVPAQSSPPKASSPATQPTPAPAPPKDSYNTPPVKEDPSNDQASSITSPAAAPKPTPGSACVPGGKCITVTEVATVVQTVYVTVAADGYKRGVQAFKARRMHARHM